MGEATEVALRTLAEKVGQLHKLCVRARGPLQRTWWSGMHGSLLL